MKARKVISNCMIMLLLGGPCFCATTYTVDDDGPADFNTIQAAINTAVIAREMMMGKIVSPI